MSETSHPQSEPPQGISLGELTEAFARAMGAEAEVEAAPVEPSQEAVDPEVDLTSEQQREPPPEDGPCEISPRTIFEAMLFVGNRENQPLTADRAAGLMRDVEPAEIAEMAEQLNQQYAANGRPYRIENEGSGYRLVLRKAFHRLRNRFFGRVREARLSQAAVDTLAIVAYQQPLTTEQINRLRAKPSNHLLTQLVRRGLLRIERRDSKRRTASYFTTDRFLKLFGLESIDDLPQSEEVEW